MHEQRLYSDLASLWPLLSPPAHYTAEARVVREVIEHRLPAAKPGRRSLLELGAGGGHTICHLRDTFECVALDASDAMLANCRTLNPGVETIVGDMRKARLDRAFDAVLIHDAIDYLLTEDDVRATLDTAAAHLTAGGVALIAPTYTRETFTEHETEQDQHSDDERMLTYFSYVHDPDPSDSTFELILVYLINEAGALRIEHDRHTCGLFDEATWQRLLREAGFELASPATQDDAWTLFVGVKV